MPLSILSPFTNVLPAVSSRSVQFLERCAELTHGVGFDVILETAGLGDYRDLQRLKPSKEDLLMALGSHGTLATRVSDLEVGCSSCRYKKYNGDEDERTNMKE